jgi:hypothetical protein
VEKRKEKSLEMRAHTDIRAREDKTPERKFSDESSKGASPLSPTGDSPREGIALMEPNFPASQHHTTF